MNSFASVDKQLNEVTSESLFSYFNFRNIQLHANEYKFVDNLIQLTLVFNRSMRDES